MKLTGWSIDGFGVFRNYEVRGLGDGLTIFCGPNEAGKSTLLAFLRGMLFGFADGRSRDGRYLPLRGGRHGGRLFLRGPENDGDYIVERHPGTKPPLRITLPNGREGSDTDLHRLLGGSDDRLYRSIFAFSLTELQSFDTLTAEGVRDRIFSAGIAGAGRSARHAIKELDRRAGVLLRARAQAPLNDRLADLATVRTRLEAARAAAASYLAHVRDEEENSAEIVSLGQQSESLRRLKVRYHALLDVLPLWDETQSLRREFEALEPVDHVPADAETRLAGVVQEIKAAEQTLVELIDFQAAAERRLETLRPHDALAEIGDEVEQLFEGLSLHRSLVQQLPAARQRLALTNETLDERLRELGPEWDEARIEAFDRSIPRLEEVRSWHQRLEHNARDIERLKHDIESAEARKSRMEEARMALEAGQAPAPFDEAAIEERARTIRRLRANLSDLRVEETEASSHDMFAKERERAIRLLETEPLVSLPAWPIVLVWMIALLTPVVLWIRGEPAILPAIAGSLIAVAVTFMILQRRRHGAVERERRKSDLVSLGRERQRAAEQRSTHLRRAAALSGTIAADTTALGLGLRPSLHDLEECDNAVGAQRAAVQQWKERNARLVDASAQARDATHDIQRLIGELEQAYQRRDGEQDRWMAWKRSVGLSEALSPQALLDYFDTIRVGQEALLARTNATADAARMTQQVAAWEERAHALLAAAGLRVRGLEEDALIEQLVQLRKRAAEDRQTRIVMAALQQEVSDRTARIAVVQTTLDRRREDRLTVLSEANAEDEEGLHRRVEVFRRRTALRTRIRDLERQLSARIGQGSDANVFCEDLERGSEDEWRTAIEDVEARVEAVQNRRDDAIGRHRDAQRARLALEASTDIASLELEREGLEAELATVVRQWQVLTIARALIEDTLREFERTRQPAVLAEASEMFAFITNGRYQRLLQEHDGEQIAVLDAKGGRRPAEALSRGTAEQLYLCVRLALAAEFARRSEPLPLVMDDVLVNFDPERARSVASVLTNVARSHQILLFTCHPSTRELLVGADPDAHIVELQSYAASEAEPPPRERMTAGWDADANGAGVSETAETPELDLIDRPK